MNSAEIAAYTLDGSIYCPGCADRTDHRYTVQIGRRYGSSSSSAVYTGEIDLGTHDSLRMAVEYAREQCALDLDDAGEIEREDGTATHWVTDEIDGEPIFAGYETDTPDHCGQCGDLIDGQSLTRDGRRYVVEQIAEYIADGRGDVDTLAAWSDLTDNSYTAADLEMARSCFDSIEGTYSHGTLRPQDLLEASIDAAQALHDWIACTPEYHNGNTRMCADLQNEMVRAEQALAAMRQPDTVEEIHECDVPTSLLEASCVASDYHGGMGTGLYALSCAQWQHLTRADMRRAAREMRTVAEQTGDDEPRIYATVLETWTEQHPPVDEDDPAYALESIDDTINAHLPAPLYYGAREGDGSDIAIQVSAED